MSKECLNELEMSKAEEKINEFFNNADAVQAEEGAWYYSESSVNSELLSIYAELAKANKRLKELELVTVSITHADETGYVDDVGFVEGWSDVCNETKALLKKFAIKKKIEVLENTLRENSRPIAYPHGHNTDVIYSEDIEFDIEQLRKEQSND